MNPSLQIKVFEDQDTQGLLDLMNQVSAPGVFSYVEDLSPHPDRFHSVQGKNSKTFVALAEGQVVGSIGYYTQNVTTGDDGIKTLAFVQELRIHPDWRGKGLSEGLGKLLITELRTLYPSSVCMGVVERKNQAVLAGVYPRWKKNSILDFRPVLPFTVFMLPVGRFLNRKSATASFQEVPAGQIGVYYQARTKATQGQSLRSTDNLDGFLSFLSRAQASSQYRCFTSAAGDAGYGLWNQSGMRSYRLLQKSEILKSFTRILLKTTPDGRIPIRYLHDLWTDKTSIQNYQALVQDGLQKCRDSGGRILCIAAPDGSELYQALSQFIHFKTEMYLVRDHFSPEFNLGKSTFLEAALG